MSIGEQRSAQRLLNELLDSINPPSPPTSTPSSQSPTRTSSPVYTGYTGHVRSVSSSSPSRLPRGGHRRVHSAGAELQLGEVDQLGSSLSLPKKDSTVEGAEMVQEGSVRGAQNVPLSFIDQGNERGNESPAPVRALDRIAPTLHVVHPSTSTTRSGTGIDTFNLSWSQTDNTQLQPPRPNADRRLSNPEAFAAVVQMMEQGQAARVQRAESIRSEKGTIQSMRSGKSGNLGKRASIPRPIPLDLPVPEVTEGVGERVGVKDVAGVVETGSTRNIGEIAKKSEQANNVERGANQGSWIRAQTKRRNGIGPASMIKRIASKASVSKLRIKPPPASRTVDSAPQTGDPLLGPTDSGSSHVHAVTTAPNVHKDQRRITFLRPAPLPPDRPTTPNRFAPSSSRVPSPAPSGISQTSKDRTDHADHADHSNQAKQAKSPPLKRASSPYPSTTSPNALLAPVQEHDTGFKRLSSAPPTPTPRAASGWLKNPNLEAGPNVSPGRTLSVREDGMVEIPRFKKRELNLGMVPCGAGRRVIWGMLWIWVVVWALGSLFLDASLLFMLVQCAMTPPSSNDAGSRSWTFATAAYGVCMFISIGIVWLGWGVWYEYWRRWRLPRPAIEPIHTSLPASLHLSLTSFPHFCFLLHIRLSPRRTSYKWDFLPETAHLVLQTIPHLIPVLPRASIAIVMLVAFTGNPEVSRNGKDPNFWTSAGGLTPFAQGVIYALLGITALRILLALIAGLIIWIFSRRRLPSPGHSGSRSIRNRRYASTSSFGDTPNIGSINSSGPSTPPRRRDPASTSSPSKGWVAESDFPWAWRERGRNRLQDAFELCMMRPTRKMGRASVGLGLGLASAGGGGGFGSVEELGMGMGRVKVRDMVQFGRDAGVHGGGRGKGKEDISPTSADPFMGRSGRSASIRFVEPVSPRKTGVSNVDNGPSVGNVRGDDGEGKVKQGAEMLGDDQETVLDAEHPPARPELLLEPQPGISPTERAHHSGLEIVSHPAGTLPTSTPRTDDTHPSVVGAGASGPGQGPGPGLGLGALPAARQSTSSQDLFYTPLTRTPATEKGKSEVELGFGQSDIPIPSFPLVFKSKTDAVTATAPSTSTSTLTGTGTAASAASTDIDTAVAAAAAAGVDSSGTTSSGSVTPTPNPTPPSAYRRPVAPAPSSLCGHSVGLRVDQSGFDSIGTTPRMSAVGVGRMDITELDRLHGIVAGEGGLGNNDRTSEDDQHDHVESDDDSTALLSHDGHAVATTMNGRRRASASGSVRSISSVSVGAVAGLRNALSSPSLRNLRARAGSIVSLSGAGGQGGVGVGMGTGRGKGWESLRKEAGVSGMDDNVVRMGSDILPGREEGKEVGGGGVRGRSSSVGLGGDGVGMMGGDGVGRGAKGYGDGAVRKRRSVMGNVGGDLMRIEGDDGQSASGFGVGGIGGIGVGEFGALRM